MPAVAKELDNRRQGDRRQCSMCNPRPDTVPMWKVWAWSLEHSGESPFRSA